MIMARRSGKDKMQKGDPYAGDTGEDKVQFPLHINKKQHAWLLMLRVLGFDCNLYYLRTLAQNMSGKTVQWGCDAQETIRAHLRRKSHKSHGELRYEQRPSPPDLS
eukprot:COSAG05_NODE_1739_length_4161_cov_4.587642_4_plen_106_part_00